MKEQALSDNAYYSSLLTAGRLSGEKRRDLEKRKGTLGWNGSTNDTRRRAKVQTYQFRSTLVDPRYL